MLYSVKVKKALQVAFLTFMISSPFCSFASAATAEEIDAEIKRQQEYLTQLESKKAEAENTSLRSEISRLTAQVNALNAQKQEQSSFNAEKAFNELNSYFWNMYDQWVAEKDTVAKLVESVSQLTTKISEITAAVEASKIAPEDYPESASDSYQRGALVNPGPTKSIGYTQDAANAQGNSTMTFRYTDTQLYKIYCRAGYLTDIALHEKEALNFVGGGDSSSWSVTSATVGDTVHIYIKPIIETGTTNLIITTNKRSYQLILEAGDWYNPMVRWTYDEEALQRSILRDQKDKFVVTDNLAVPFEELNFDYKVEKNTSSYKPKIIFDDTEKTIIKFTKIPQNAPAIFVKEKDRKAVNMVSYQIKDNCYILDRVAEKIELRYNESEFTTISCKKIKMY